MLVKSLISRKYRRLCIPFEAENVKEEVKESTYTSREIQVSIEWDFLVLHSCSKLVTLKNYVT